jgi:hypothetical protein
MFAVCRSSLWTMSKRGGQADLKEGSLHVTDDGDFVIPYEPVFGDAGELHWVIKQEPFFNKSSISS